MEWVILLLSFTSGLPPTHHDDPPLDPPSEDPFIIELSNVRHIALLCQPDSHMTAPLCSHVSTCGLLPPLCRVLKWSSLKVCVCMRLCMHACVCVCVCVDMCTHEMNCSVVIPPLPHCR